LKYLRLGCKDIGDRKSEFVTKTQIPFQKLLKNKIVIFFFILKK